MPIIFREKVFSTKFTTLYHPLDTSLLQKSIFSKMYLYSLSKQSFLFLTNYFSDSVTSIFDKVNLSISLTIGNKNFFFISNPFSSFSEFLHSLLYLVIYCYLNQSFLLIFFLNQSIFQLDSFFTSSPVILLATLFQF